MTSFTVDAPVKSSGRAGPKSKRGCLTCKARKVKCDETHPACRRCTSTGRPCDGYGVWGGGTFVSTNASRQAATQKHSENTQTHLMLSKPTSPPKALGIRHVSRPEQECFDWFLRRSCIKLPGLNTPRFWKSTLLQASTTERPVMHAVLALGSLHLRAAEETMQGWLPAKLETFMLKQYSQALHHLQPLSKKNSSDSLAVTLITAVVFVYFEFLRSNYRTGCTHLHFLLRLLNETEDLTISSCDLDLKRNDLENHWILEPVLRLYIQAQLTGQISFPLPMVFQRAAFKPLPAIFNSLHHARWYLDLLVAETLHLQHELERQCAYEHNQNDAYSRSTLDDTIQSAKIIEAHLNIWNTSFAATMTAISPKATPRDHFRYAASCNFHRMTVVMIYAMIQSNCTTTTTAANCLPLINEEVYDTHTHTFLLNLNTAMDQFRSSFDPRLRAQILGSGFIDRKHSEPTIDQGWLHHLFFTAVKCRVHRVRQHALRLMRTTYHKEGIWDTEWVVLVAEEVVRLEEGEFFHPEPEESNAGYAGRKEPESIAPGTAATTATGSFDNRGEPRLERDRCIFDDAEDTDNRTPEQRLRSPEVAPDDVHTLLLLPPHTTTIHSPRPQLTPSPPSLPSKSTSTTACSTTPNSTTSTTISSPSYDTTPSSNQPSATDPPRSATNTPSTSTAANNDCHRHNHNHNRPPPNLSNTLLQEGTPPQCPCIFSLLTPPPAHYYYNDNNNGSGSAPYDLVTLPVERRLHGLKITLPEGTGGVLAFEFCRKGWGAGGGPGAGGWVWERRELVMGFGGNGYGGRGKEAKARWKTVAFLVRDGGLKDKRREMSHPLTGIVAFP